jgi:(5-formylfuran-3-yl)methyl phosphate synthase
MTKLLASVMSAGEAQIALDCGADIIDCKDASSGALGALPNETVSAIVELVGGGRPVSATIGDLPMQPDLIVAAVASKFETGVDFVKIGLLEEGYPRRYPSAVFNPREDGGKQTQPHSKARQCIAHLAPFARKTSLIAVLFADQQPELDLLPLIADSGFAGVMFDTADKSSGSLTHHASRLFLASFVYRAKELALTAGLAGSLKPEDVPTLLELEPDYLGFRGALCARQRSSHLEPSRILELNEVIRACQKYPNLEPHALAGQEI